MGVGRGVGVAVGKGVGVFDGVGVRVGVATGQSFFWSYVTVLHMVQLFPPSGLLPMDVLNPSVPGYVWLST